MHSIHTASRVLVNKCENQTICGVFWRRCRWILKLNRFICWKKRRLFGYLEKKIGTQNWKLESKKTKWVREILNLICQRVNSKEQRTFQISRVCKITKNGCFLSERQTWLVCPRFCPPNRWSEFSTLIWKIFTCWTNKRSTHEESPGN